MASVKIIMSVRLSPWNNLAPTGRAWNLMCEYFSNSCRENSSSITIGPELRVLYMKTNIHFWSHLAQFFLEWETVSDKIYRGNHNTHFVFNNIFIFENRAVYKVEKCYRAGQATDDNMVHAHYMLDI